MTTLTWRNVEAPNFRSSNEITSLAADLLNKAGSGALSAVDNFDNAIKDKQNSFALNSVMQYQDADALKQALSAGAAFGGVDPTRLSAETLRTGADRVGSLMGQAASKQEFDHNAVTYANAADQYQREVDASPDIASLVSAAQSGDQSRIAAATSGIKDSRLLGSQQLAVLAKATDIARGSLDNQNASTKQGWEKTAHNDVLQGNALATEALERYGSGESAVRYIRENSTGLSPEAKNYAIAMARQPDPTSAAISAATTSTSTASPGVPNAYASTWGNDKYYKAKQPVDTMTIAQSLAAGREQIAATKGKLNDGSTDGTSVLGAFQIRNREREVIAKRLWPNNWQNVVYDAKAQEAIGEALFDEAKSGDLTKVWTGLKGVPGANVPGAYKNKTWAQVREVIAEREGGRLYGQPDSLRAAHDAATVNLLKRSSENNSAAMTGAFVQYANDQASPAEVAENMIKQGVAKGVTKDALIASINAGMRMPEGKNLTAAQIGWGVVARGLDPSWWGQKAYRAATGNADNGAIVTNSKALAEGVKQMGSMNIVDMTTRNMALKRGAERLQTARSMYEQAALALQAARVAKSSGGTPKLDEQTYLDRYSAAERNLSAVTAAVQSSDPFNPTEAPPSKAGARIAADNSAAQARAVALATAAKVKADREAAAARVQAKADAIIRSRVSHLSGVGYSQ